MTTTRLDSTVGDWLARLDDVPAAVIMSPDGREAIVLHPLGPTAANAQLTAARLRGRRIVVREVRPTRGAA
jgi:hypothetical protein